MSESILYTQGFVYTISYSMHFLEFDDEIQNITIEVLTDRIKTEDVEPVDCGETGSNQASLSVWAFVACIVVFTALLCLLVYLRIKERYFLSLRVQ